MVLSDGELYELCIGEFGQNKGGLVYPITELSIQPASVDIRLGLGFKKPKYSQNGVSHSFDKEVKYEKCGEYFYTLRPHEFCLGTTVECVNLPNNMTAFVEGRSSIGRMGLFIQNAGWVDPGFRGEITLELFNASDVPILLHAGTRVAQLVFCKTSSSCVKPYKGKYQNQKGTTGSKINYDDEIGEKPLVTPEKVGSIVQDPNTGEYGVILSCNGDGTATVLMGISDAGNRKIFCRKLDKLIIKE